LTLGSITNFPNIIYIVAFDRFRVENALNEEGISGREYLEKILQIAIDLPPIPYPILSAQLTTAIENALQSIDKVGPFDSQAWPDIFMEIIRPLIKTMRDVRRYAANIHLTVDSFDGEVALNDVLALEAVRLFLPDVFKLLYLSTDALTTTEDPFLNDRRFNSVLKAKIEKIIDVAGDNSYIVRDMICRLFPAARRHIDNYIYGEDQKKEWLRKRRVAHEDILNFYLERVTGDQFKAFLHAEKAMLFLDNRVLLDNYLRSLDANEIIDVISSLEIYEDQFTDKHVEPASIVLLNIMYELPNNYKSLFDLGVRHKVRRVVYRLIRSLRNPDPIERAVKSILPEVKTLSAKYELISLVGHKENIGHKLISQEASRQIELEWVHEVKIATVEDLLKEPKLLRILLYAKKSLLEGGELLEISDNNQFTLAVLKSSQSEVLSQSMDSRFVQKGTRLAWDSLIELYGNEDLLIKRIDQAKDLASADNKEIIELAEKYKNGWRPED